MMKVVCLGARLDQHVVARHRVLTEVLHNRGTKSPDRITLQQTTAVLLSTQTNKTLPTLTLLDLGPNIPRSGLRSHSLGHSVRSAGEWQDCEDMRQNV